MNKKEEALAQRDNRAKYVRLVRRVRSNIRDSSYLSVTYKLDMLEECPSVESISDLPRAEIIRAYKEALQQHLNYQQKKKL